MTDLSDKGEELVIFHFGTENWEEQLKKHPVYP